MSKQKLPLTTIDDILCASGENAMSKGSSTRLNSFFKIFQNLKQFQTIFQQKNQKRKIRNVQSKGGNQIWRIIAITTLPKSKILSKIFAKTPFPIREKGVESIVKSQKLTYFVLLAKSLCGISLVLKVYARNSKWAFQIWILQNGNALIAFE